MKILVISDSHGHIANLKAVMEIGKKADVKTVIHCGDWDNLQAVSVIESYKIPLYSVLGNADIDPNFKLKDYLEIEIDGKKIGIIHDLKSLSQISNLDIVFCGHTQKQYKEGKIVNPGALENGINFAIYDTVTGGVEFFEDE